MRKSWKAFFSWPSFRVNISELEIEADVQKEIHLWAFNEHLSAATLWKLDLKTSRTGRKLTHLSYGTGEGSCIFPGQQRWLVEQILGHITPDMSLERKKTPPNCHHTYFGNIVGRIHWRSQLCLEELAAKGNQVNQEYDGWTPSKLSEQQTIQISSVTSQDVERLGP